MLTNCMNKEESVPAHLPLRRRPQALVQLQGQVDVKEVAEVVVHVRLGVQLDQQGGGGHHLITLLPTLLLLLLQVKKLRSP